MTPLCALPRMLGRTTVNAKPVVSYYSRISNELCTAGVRSRERKDPYAGDRRLVYAR